MHRRLPRERTILPRWGRSCGTRPGGRPPQSPCRPPLPRRRGPTLVRYCPPGRRRWGARL